MLTFFLLQKKRFIGVYIDNYNFEVWTKSTERDYLANRNQFIRFGPIDASLHILFLSILVNDISMCVCVFVPLIVFHLAVSCVNSFPNQKKVGFVTNDQDRFNYFLFYCLSFLLTKLWLL